MTMSNKANFKFSLAMMIVFVVLFAAAVAALASGVISAAVILALLSFLTVISGFIAAAFLF